MAEILNYGVLPYSYYHGRREVHQLFGIMIKCAKFFYSSLILYTCRLYRSHLFSSPIQCGFFSFQCCQETLQRQILPHFSWWNR